MVSLAHRRADAPGLPALLARKTLHEIAPAAPADGPAAFGFALGLAAKFLAASPAHGLIVAEDFSLREHGALYAPGLAAQGLDLNRIVVARAPNALAAFAAMEEGLKSGALAFALGEIWDLRPYSLTVSRRLLLAARKGATPGLLVQSSAYRLAGHLSTAAETRLEIAAAPSRGRAPAGGGRPLPGAPAFSARLVKAKLGQGPPGDIDPDKVFLLHWRADLHDFRDFDFDQPAIPQPLAAAPADRPGAPPQRRAAR